MTESRNVPSADIRSVNNGWWRPRTADGPDGIVGMLEDEVEFLTLALTEVHKWRRQHFNKEELELVERALNWVNRA